jgi:hypothetical protein
VGKFRDAKEAQDKQRPEYSCQSYIENSPFDFSWIVPLVYSWPVDIDTTYKNCWGEDNAGQGSES